VRRIGGASKDPAARLVTAVFDLTSLAASPLFSLLPRMLHGSLVLIPFESWALRIADFAEGIGGSAFLSRLIELIFAQSVRAHVEAARLQPFIVRAGSIRAPIAEATRLINTRPQFHWTLTQLAAEARMSRSSFVAAFTATMGEPPMSYLTRVRMMRAAELVSFTSMPLTDIVTAVGYESAPSFCRLFNRWHSMPPGRMRKLAHSAELGGGPPLRPKI
jgi:AraC-like DNA-binding protein